MALAALSIIAFVFVALGQARDTMLEREAAANAIRWARFIRIQLPDLPTAFANRQLSEQQVVRIDRAQRRSRVLAVVTVALAAAAAVFLIMRPRPPAEFGDDAVRTGVDKRIRPAEGMDRLPKDAFTLRWVGGPESATYDLFVTTSDLRVVYQALEQPATEHTVPGATLADLARGTTLLWRVVAVTSDGRKIHSTAFEVVIE